MSNNCIASIMSFATRLAVVILTGLLWLDYPRILATVLLVIIVSLYYHSSKLSLDDAQKMIDEINRQKKELHEDEEEQQ